SHVLGSAGERVLANGVLLVDADLRKTVPVEQLKPILRDMQSVSEKLFVVQSHLRDMVAQAFALGATAVVSRPKEIVTKLAQVELATRSTKPGSGAAPAEIANSAEYFASMFSAIGKGKQIALSDAADATLEVIDG